MWAKENEHDKPSAASAQKEPQKCHEFVAEYSKS